MKETPPPILPITLPNGFTFDMIYVEGGEFDMGGTEYDDEKPIHPVRVNSFYLGKFQVTQALWLSLEKENPADFKGENRPVENVSWIMAKDFIKKLNTQLASEGVTQSHPVGIPPLGGRGFRLPTEAEWEYAARGGIYSQGYTYAGSDKLKQVGWYDENSGNETHDVGLLLGNELGIHDLSGNVWEWCEDWYDEKYYEKCKKKGLVENPTGADRGGGRVLRGGSCFGIAVSCRPASRDGSAPDYLNFNIGFRLCLPLQLTGMPDGIH